MRDWPKRTHAGAGEKIHRDTRLTQESSYSARDSNTFRCLNKWTALATEWGEEGQMKGLLNRIVAQFVVEIRPADLEQLGRFHSIAVGFLERIKNTRPFAARHGFTGG